MPEPADRPPRFLSVLTGSFAMPAAENPTVAMVEAAYRHHGIDARYVNCEVAPEALGDAVRGARAMGWAGFNCSIPHKVAVIAHLDGLGESARIIGAVNTVVRRGERLIGENTDGKGFVAALKAITDPAGVWSRITAQNAAQIDSGISTHSASGTNAPARTSAPPINWSAATI